MPLTHKFIDELNLLEQSQIFCNQKISSKSKILVLSHLPNLTVFNR